MTRRICPVEQRADRHRPRRRGRHADEVEDHEGPAPGGRPQHDRSRAWSPYVRVEPQRDRGRRRPRQRDGSARTSRSRCRTSCSRSRRSRTGPGTRSGSPGRPGRRRRPGHRHCIVAYGDTPLLEGEASRRSRPCTRRPERAVSILTGMVASPAATDGSSATPTVRSRRSWRSGTPPPSSGRSARSTAGSWPSTPTSSAERAAEDGQRQLQGRVLPDRHGAATPTRDDRGAFAIDDVSQTEGANDRGSSPSSAAR